MSIYIDLIIIAIILLTTFLGYKKGLIKVVIKILSFFIAIIVALVLYKPVANIIINNTQLDESIEQIIIEKIGSEDVNEVELTEQNAENTPQVVRNYLNESIKNVTDDVRDNVAVVVAENFSVLIINAISAIGLFILTKIALLIINCLAGLIEKIPIIKQFNKAGGTIYGILEGLVIVYLILAIISIISPLISNTMIINDINSSIIGSIMYNNNILLNIIF